jgi:hypothetical protein
MRDLGGREAAVSGHGGNAGGNQCLQIETGWIVPTKQASVYTGSREDQVHAFLYVLYRDMVVFSYFCSKIDSS